MKNYLFNIIFVSGILFVALSAYLLLSSRIFSPYCITIGLIGVYLLFASSVLCLFSQHQIYFKLTLGLFNLDPGQGNADMLDCYRFGPIIRSSARSLPTIFRETRRFEHVIANTRLVPRRSALLVPTTSLRVVQPAWAVHAQMAPLVQALEGREFFFVPEEVLVSGEEDLAEFDLLLVPYAVALPAEVSERILAFVQRGGTVVAGGPIGVTGPYGRPDGRIAKAVFGDVTPHWNPERARAAGLGKLAVRRDPGYEWWFGGGGLVPDDRCRTFEPELAWFLDELPADTEVVARHDDMPVVVARQHGKGRLVWCVWPMSNLPDRNPVAQAIAKTIPHAQVETDMRLWDSDRVLREDDRGNRYLFLVNHDPHALQPFKTYGAAGREGWITLDGVYPRVVDLSVPGGAPVPVDSRAGRTRFRTRLDPGEAVVYFLGRGRPQPWPDLLTNHRGTKTRSGIGRWDASDTSAVVGPEGYSSEQSLCRPQERTICSFPITSVSLCLRGALSGHLPWPLCRTVVDVEGTAVAGETAGPPGSLAGL